MSDQLRGGLADRRRPEDFDARELARGQRVEREHTFDPKVATEIAMDHLTEDPDYYLKLASLRLNGPFRGKIYRVANDVAYDDDNEDLDDRDDWIEQAWCIAQSSTINVHDKELSHVAVLDDEVVGAAFNSIDGGVFSFDIVVSPHVHRQGAGSALVGAMEEEYRDTLEAYDDLALEVQVVDEGMMLLLAGVQEGVARTRPVHGGRPVSRKPKIRKPLRKGSLVYHGTSSEEDFVDLQGPAWVSDSEAVARYFVTWHKGKGPLRILVYRVIESPSLVLCEGQREWDSFLEWMSDQTGEYDMDPLELAEGVCDQGLDGWHIPNNYPSGSDTLLCDPERFLEFVEVLDA